MSSESLLKGSTRILKLIYWNDIKNKGNVRDSHLNPQGLTLGTMQTTATTKRGQTYLVQSDGSVIGNCATNS